MRTTEAVVIGGGQAGLAMSRCLSDRGIDAKVGHAGWEAICRAMETEFRAGRFEQGVIKGIAAVSRELAKHFPPPAGPNELPDRPVVI